MCIKCLFSNFQITPQLVVLTNHYYIHGKYGIAASIFDALMIKTMKTLGRNSEKKLFLAVINQLRTWEYRHWIQH